MDKIQQLLTLLKNNDSVSNSKILQTLQITDLTVFQIVNQLNDIGFLIELTPTGYQLKQTPLTINHYVLKQALPTYEITTYQTTTSTNDNAKQAINNDIKTPALFISNEQTAGRGTRQRSFFSPNGSGIYMSLLLPCEQLTPFMSLMTPLSAVAVLKAIQKVIGITPQIKWINDLLVNNKKVCGILTETISNGSTGNITHLIIGIGINVYRINHLPNDLMNTIGHLSDTPVDFNALIIEITKNITTLLEQLPSTAFLNTYKKYCFTLGQPLLIHEQQGTIQAKAIDIDNTGKLIVQKEDGTIDTLYHNNISLNI